jgi:hypothetical protein
MRIVVALLSVLAPVAWPGPVWAGPAGADAPAIVSSSPRAGGAVQIAPPVVTLKLSAPVKHAAATVIDGCRQPVPSTIGVVGDRVSIRLSVSHIAALGHDHVNVGGRWQIAWQADRASGELAFSVGGPADCRALSSVPLALPAPPPERPEFLYILYTLAGVAALSAFVRIATRRSSTAPQRDR